MGRNCGSVLRFTALSEVHSLGCRTTVEKLVDHEPRRHLGFVSERRIVVAFEFAHLV